jgi:hypothetical protein
MADTLSNVSTRWWYDDSCFVVEVDLDFIIVLVLLHYPNFEPTIICYYSLMMPILKQQIPIS